MNKQSKVFLIIFITLIFISQIGAQTNLATTCELAKNDIAQIDNLINIISTTPDKAQQNLATISKKWEQKQLENKCFTFGNKPAFCKEPNNLFSKELKLTNRIIFITRTISKDIESNKNANVIIDNYQRHKVKLDSVMKKLCN